MYLGKILLLNLKIFSIVVHFFYSGNIFWIPNARNFIAKYNKSSSCILSESKDTNAMLHT